MVSVPGEMPLLWDTTGSQGGCSWIESMKTFMPREAEPCRRGLVNMDAWSVVHSQGLLLGNVEPNKADVYSCFISCRWKVAGGPVAAIKCFVW